MIQIRKIRIRRRPYPWEQHPKPWNKGPGLVVYR